MAKTARKNASSIPFLPGYSGRPGLELTAGHKKGQTLVYAPGGETDAQRPLEALQRSRGEVPKLDLKLLQTLSDPTHRYNYSTRSLTHEERLTARESARNTYRPAIAPAWLKHDRQVLRFYAYFMEPVHENPRENFRVRQCSIHFYLEDGTMMVTEPRVQNSGIMQGTFVKRHRIPKPKGQGGVFYECTDLGVRSTVVIYARAFRIYDCDEFTRTFYEEALGVALGPAEEPPMDAFEAAEVQARAQPASPRLKALAESKEYTELAMGGSRKNAKLQQYLENDRKVLAFKCYFDDPQPYGARMYYTLHYHLADDTVEILENLARNTGRDPYPVFWRRAPLRKNPFVSPAPGMLEPEPIIYKPEDFVVGQTINVYGRDILLYDCDEFTRDFYRQYTGHEQGRIEIPNPPVVHVRLSYPPHTGFGSEEDSLGSCIWLTPRPPCKAKPRRPPAAPEPAGPVPGPGSLSGHLAEGGLLPPGGLA